MDLLLKIRWRPEIGDPSPMGWATVVAYALAAVLSWRAWRGSRQRLWLAVTVLMAALCVNKQFDLQSLVTDIGREIARYGGWYERRRGIQKLFVLGLLAAAGVSAAWLGWKFRALLVARKLLAAGLLFLLTFIAIRAISFHHVDVFLGARIAGLRMNWVLELTGIALVALAAWRERPARIRT